MAFRTEQIGDCTMIHGDCLARMESIDAGSIDLILCDLPYGTTACKWDTVIPFEPLWAQYKRIIKPRGAIVLTASQPFTSALVMSNRAMFRYEWVWEKNLPTGFLDANRKPLKSHESCLVFSKGSALYFPQGVSRSRSRSRSRKKGTAVYGKFGYEYETTGVGFPRSVLKFSRVHHPGHPTQKPVALMEYMIRTYTNEGETVLDNCMGSGTTGVACIRTGRKFIGIEKDEIYFNIACERIRKEYASTPLIQEVA